MQCVNDSILKYKQLQHSVLGVKVFAKDTIRGFHNQTILLKIKDIKCDFETALAWAVSAKNSLSSSNGFSPAQLAFGRNSSLANFSRNTLPAP